MLWWYNWASKLTPDIVFLRYTPSINYVHMHVVALIILIILHLGGLLQTWMSCTPGWNLSQMEKKGNTSEDIQIIKSWGICHIFPNWTFKLTVRKFSHLVTLLLKKQIIDHWCDRLKIWILITQIKTISAVLHRFSTIS